MRTSNILLAIVGVFLVQCDAVSFDHTKLSKVASPDLIQANNAVQNDPTENRFLRTSKTADDETDSTGDEEERGVTDLAKKLKQAAHTTKLKLNAHIKLITDPDIKANLNTFKGWYKSGKTPENVWQDLKLQPVLLKAFDSARIDMLKANPNYQLYLNYVNFYKIKKGTYGRMG